MASNPYTNKVVYEGQTLIDLTEDTVTPSDVLSGVSFHDRSGASQQGTLTTQTITVTPGTPNTPTAVTLPALTMTYNNGTLELAWSAGSVTAGVANVPTVVNVSS